MNDTVHCPECGSAVTALVFCGDCGAYLTPRRGGRPAFLRPGAFCAAPQESVFRPSLASSLLPQLSELTRRPFNLGLVMIVLAMAVVVELHLPGAIIAVAALGLPLLLVIYWLRAGVLQELPLWAVLTTVVLAIGLAAGWVLLTGDLITTMTESAFGAGTVGRRVLRDGLGIAEGGTLLMLLPTVVVRLLWRNRREALDGFVLGVLAALLFTATATLTRLAPQFAAAPVARNQPVHWLFFEAAIRGVTVPVTAACAGGLIGAALWFERPARKPDRAAERSTIVALVLCAVAVLGVYAVMGWADVEGTSQLAVLLWHTGMAIFALIAVRVGLQLALLNEGSHRGAGGPFCCLSCRAVFAEREFCPACGVAIHASTARARRQRRSTSPEDAGRQSLSPLPALTTWLAAMAALSAVFVAVPALTVKSPPRYNCPPDCGSPPQGRPVSANPRFTSADGGFSVGYPAPGTAYDVRIDDKGVTATFTSGDGGNIRLTAEPAAGRTAQDVARAVVTSRFPTATKAFEIPNAMVGFEPGYGEVADIFPLNLDTSYTRLRSVVVVAIKNDLALIAAAVGPYHEFGPNFGPGRPSPTNLQIAEDLGRYVNSFRWRGDPLG